MSKVNQTFCISDSQSVP